MTFQVLCAHDFSMVTSMQSKHTVYILSTLPSTLSEINNLADDSYKNPEFNPNIVLTLTLMVMLYFRNNG